MTSRAGDLRASSADIAKARELLGYEPRVKLEDGLAALVATLREGLARAA